MGLKDVVGKAREVAGNVAGAGILVLAAGEIGNIKVDMSNIPEPVGNITRSLDKETAIHDLPQNGIDAWRKAVVAENIALKDGVATLTGKTNEDGRLIYRGDETDKDWCKRNNFNIKATVRTNDGKAIIDITFGQGERGSNYSVKGLPLGTSAGVGLIRDINADADLSVGCHLLLNTSEKPDTLVVMKYEGSQQVTIDYGAITGKVAKEFVKDQNGGFKTHR